MKDDALIERLAIHVVSINLDAKRGNQRAKDIQQAYRNWHQCREVPSAKRALEKKLADWLAERRRR